MVESFDTMFTALLVVLCVGGCAGAVTGASGPQCGAVGLDQVLDNLVRDKDIELSRGVKFVKVTDIPEVEGGRSTKDSVLSRIKRFFTNHELQVKLSDIYQKKQGIKDAFRRAFTTLNEMQEGNEETSRGKGSGGFGGGKKGGGAILVMATMMGGMMAALGYGALAMLVMKALTVSSMALLLSAVIGLRRLLRRPDDDAGFGRISYIPVHTEHRRRRSFQNAPFRAYAKYK